MYELWAVLVLLAQDVIPKAPNSAVPWGAGATVSGILLYWLWEERKERREVSKLLLDVYKEASAKLSEGLQTLDKAIDYFERRREP